VREYLVELERENPVEAPVAQQEKLLTTDSGLDLRGQKRSGAAWLLRRLSDR
jgi:hypothetical protein